MLRMMIHHHYSTADAGPQWRGDLWLPDKLRGWSWCDGEWQNCG